MVQSRKEPTISSGDLSLPLDDDLSGRARTSKPGSKPTAPAARSTSAQAKSGSKVGGVALLIGLIGVVVAGFSLWLNWQMSVQLTEATARIQELESRLALSDDESTQSVTALQASLKQALRDIGVNESEIRKLWDTRNVNRKSITDNTNAITAMQKDLGATVAKLEKSLTTKQQALEASLKTAESKIGGDDSQLDTLKSQMAGLKDVSAQLGNLKSQLATIQSLSTRVTSNEEAIEAIDAYRLNINRQLLELQQKVNGG